MGVIQFRVERPDLLSGAEELSLIDFLMYDGRVISLPSAFGERTADLRTTYFRKRADATPVAAIQWPLGGCSHDEPARAVDTVFTGTGTCARAVVASAESVLLMVRCRSAIFT